MPLNHVDNQIMQRLVGMSLGGCKAARPNPAVSAILTQGDRVVGAGVHEGPGKPHAEVLAIQAAGEEARGGTLYVSLEPCTHWGRTPPCVEAIVAAGIQRVVFGVADPNPLVRAQPAHGYLAAHGVTLEDSHMGDTFGWVHRMFFKWVTTQRPWVGVKVAVSLNGKLALRSPGGPTYVTGNDALQWVHERRALCDAILVGIGTVLADDPLLTCRIPGYSSPIKVILDPRGRLPLTARLWDETSPATVWVLVAEASVTEAHHRLGERATIVPIGMPLCWDTVMQQLSARGLYDVMIEGGLGVLQGLFEQRVVDEVDLMMAPYLSGGGEAYSFVDGHGIGGKGWSIPMTIREVTQRGADVHIQALVAKAVTK